MKRVLGKITIISLLFLAGCIQPSPTNTEKPIPILAAPECTVKTLFLTASGWVENATPEPASHTMPFNAFGYGAEAGSVRANGNIVLPVQANLGEGFTLVNASFFFRANDLSASATPFFSGVLFVDDLPLSVPLPGLMQEGQLYGAQASGNMKGVLNGLFKDGDIRLHGSTNLSTGLDRLSLRLVSEPGTPDPFGSSWGAVSTIAITYC